MGRRIALGLVVSLLVGLTGCPESEQPPSAPGYRLEQETPKAKPEAEAESEPEAGPALDRAPAAGIARHALAPSHYAPALGHETADGAQVDVDPWLGSVTLWESDLDVAGLALRRARTLGYDASGVFGRGWRSDLDARLRQVGNGYAVQRVQGQVLFSPVGEGLYVSVLGEVEFLLQDAEGFSVSDAAGRVSRFDRAGLLTAIEGEFRLERATSSLTLIGERATVTLRQDAAGRVVSAEAGEQRADYTYEAGELIAVHGPRPRRYAPSPDALLVSGGVDLVLELDPRGRLARLQEGEREQRYAFDRDGAQMDGPDGTWTYTRTADGWRVVSPAGVDRVWIDERGRVSATQQGGGPIAEVRRDRFGRQLPSAVLPGGAAVEATLDGDGRIASLKADGAEETFSYDERGRLAGYTARGEAVRLEWSGPHLAARTTAAGTSRYARDGQGHLSALTTPGGRRWSFQRDADGRLVGLDGPMGPVVLQRAASGRLVGRRDASGREWTYVHDEAGRLEEIVTAEGSERLRYDDAGRLVGLSNADGELVFGYDAAGDLVSEASAHGETRFVRDGDTDGVETPFGRFLTRRDELGRPRVLETPAGSFAFEADAHGQLTGVRFPNGVTATSGFDGHGRLRERRVTRGAESILSLDVERDAERRIASLRRDSRTTRYSHDALGRLTGYAGGTELGHGEARAHDAGADGTRAELGRGGARAHDAGIERTAYAYDADGNRAGVTSGERVESWRSDRRGRLVRAGERRVRHDAAGRVTAIEGPDGVDRFAYDGQGRLVRVQRAGSSAVRYTYDALGRIATRSVGDATTRYVYQGFQLLAQLGPGERERFFVYGPGTDRPLAVWQDGRWIYLHTDELGTVLAYTDADGERIGQATFSPFGEIEQATAGLPLFFAGRLVDREAGLVDMRARFYAPELGRFLTPDPSLLEGGENAYAYVDNSPLEQRDPLGLDGEEPTSFLDRLRRRTRSVISTGRQGLTRLARSTQRTLRRVRANPLRALDEGLNVVRRTATSELERSQRLRERVRNHLLANGYINPPGRTPAYTSTFRNLVQPALDKGYQLLHDGATGANAIAKDLTQNGITAFDDPGSAASEAYKGYHQAALNYGRLWEQEKKHVERLTDQFMANGSDPYSATALAGATWVTELFGGTKAYFEVIEGRDYKEWVENGNVKKLDGWTRTRKGFEVLLEVALALSGLKLKTPKKLPTPPASTQALPASSPRAATPPRRGMSQVLDDGPAPRAKGARQNGARAPPEHLEPDCVFVRDKKGNLQRIGEFTDDAAEQKKVLDYIRRERPDEVIVSTLEEARALKKVLRHLKGKKPKIFGGSSRRAAQNNRAAHKAREAERAAAARRPAVQRRPVAEQSREELGDMVRETMATDRGAMRRAAAELARRHGYTRRIPPDRLPFDSHGQVGYYNGRDYLTPDFDGHKGGVFKRFDRKLERTTVDHNLDWIGE